MCIQNQNQKYLKIFLIFKNGTKTPKPLFLIKHLPLGKKKLNPGKNNQIWLVVVWYRFFIRWPPFQDDHFWVVPRVVILYSFDCMLKTWSLMGPSLWQIWAYLRRQSLLFWCAAYLLSNYLIFEIQSVCPILTKCS